MSKKQLNEQNIVNELKDGSAFFPGRLELPLPEAPAKDSPTPPVIGLESPEEVSEDISQVSKRQSPPDSCKTVTREPSKPSRAKWSGTTTPRYHDTTTPRYLDTMVETIRKAVKQQGKEAATHRFTLEEKKLLRDVVYTYGAQGIRTSENEIARIAIHYLIADYHENNQMGVLSRVLERLNG